MGGNRKLVCAANQIGFWQKAAFRKDKDCARISPWSNVRCGAIAGAHAVMFIPPKTDHV